MMSICKMYFLWFWITIAVINMSHVSTANRCNSKVTMVLPGYEPNNPIIEADTFFEVLCNGDFRSDENHTLTLMWHNDVMPLKYKTNTKISPQDTTAVRFRVKSDVKYDAKMLCCCYITNRNTCTKCEITAIGYKPGNIKLKVVIFNYTTLNITWTAPENAFRASTKVRWRTTSSGEWQTCPRDVNPCTALGTFNKVNDYIIVNLNASNIIGNSESHYEKKIGKIVKPGKVQDLQVKPISNGEAFIQFKSPMAGQRHTYQLRFKCNGAKLTEKKLKKSSSRLHVSVKLRDLESDCPYDLRVKAKTGGGKMWSEEDQIRFTTPGRDN